MVIMVCAIILTIQRNNDILQKLSIYVYNVCNVVNVCTIIKFQL